MDSRAMVEEEYDLPKKQSNLKMLIICIAIPLAIGFLTYLLTSDAMKSFDTMKKPPLAPPPWLFSVAWTILYILMGIGSFAIYKSKSKDRTKMLIIYGIHLFFNMLWTPVFFIAKAYWFAFVWLVAMMLMVIYLLVKSVNVSKIAMLCFVPYAAWCMFAAYLNIGIAILN